jgi:hypothetical protein
LFPLLLLLLLLLPPLSAVLAVMQGSKNSCGAYASLQR